LKDFSPITGMLRDAVGHVFPAAQLVVVDGYAPVLDVAVGDCDPETWFDIASLTKPLSTVALTLMALDEGALTLETRPRPDCTIGELLTHASGLPAWRRLGDSRQEILRAVATEPLESPPGAVARYSDLGFILLGATVEAALGEPLDVAFARRIAAPLGVATTFCPRDPARCAPTEGALRGVVHDDNARAMGGVAGHAGLFSTARDLSRLAHAWVMAWHGARRIRAGTVPRLWPPARVRQCWTPSTVPGSTWCLGWDRPSARGSSAGEHWPKDGVGHLGFTGCSLWIDPPRARWVVLLSNRVHPSAANEAIKGFRPALHDAIVAALV
jgi:CubicO group peptidase (beta-lactamase class C family)